MTEYPPVVESDTRVKVTLFRDEVLALIAAATEARGALELDFAVNTLTEALCALEAVA